MIWLQNISKIYTRGQVGALRNINLHIAPGEYLAIVGASGSGKTTLLNVMGCLLRPTAGSCRLDGVETTVLNEAERTALRTQKIGHVFQDFRLIPRMNLLENTALPLTFRGVPREEREERAVEALCLVGLGGRLRHDPQSLSGGQRQRAALARALCTDPAVLLADEPTGNLDPAAAGEVLGLLDRLHESGRTIVLITHDRAAAARAERRIRLESGKITEF